MAEQNDSRIWVYERSGRIGLLTASALFLILFGFAAAQQPTLGFGYDICQTSACTDFSNVLSPQLYPQDSDCVAAQAAAQQQGQITQPCHQASLADYHYQVCPQGGVCGLSAIESPSQSNCQLNQEIARANGVSVGPCQVPSPSTVGTPPGANNGAGGTGAITNPLASNSLQDFFLSVINVIIVAGTYVLVMAIIYSGFLFVTAQGNEAKITQARKSLLYTVIGGAILLGAWIIATAVANTVASL